MTVWIIASATAGLLAGFLTGNHFGYWHGRWDELQLRLQELRAARHELGLPPEDDGVSRGGSYRELWKAYSPDTKG